MKKIKVNVSSLGFRSSSLVLGKELRVIKLSFEQAMRFKSGYCSFEKMVDCYGWENILNEGEYYKGYVAVYYSSWSQCLVDMDGKLCRYTDMASCIWAEPHIKEACASGTLWSVIYPLKDGKTCTGVFRYVWNFNDCNYDGWVKHLQKSKHLSEETSPEMLDMTIKTKLVNACIAKVPMEFTDEEIFVVKSYAPDYYKSFFKEV